MIRSYRYFKKFDVFVHGKIFIGPKENIKIGKYCSVNRGVIIQAYNEVIIGDYVILSNDSKLLDANIDYPYYLQSGIRKHIPSFVHIGDYCWIGAGAIILPGVRLGPHTVVGAGSVVTKSFPGSVVIAGNPAQIVKELANDT